MVAVSLAGHVLAHKTGHHHHDAASWLVALQAAAATTALLIPGRHLLKDGFTRLFKGAPNMNSMVSVGVSAAYVKRAACGGARRRQPAAGSRRCVRHLRPADVWWHLVAALSLWLLRRLACWTATCQAWQRLGGPALAGVRPRSRNL